ncbi:hypothetical protein OH492_02690 [Vibrio chagasii]|nr:hypothetical protein [Vibrio chagasii]
MKHLKSQPTYGDLVPAVVTAVDLKSAQVWCKNQGEGTIEWQSSMNWAQFPM